MNKSMYVYILANPLKTVLYTGVTNDLMRRVHEHKQGIGCVFTRRYNVSLLVYYEAHESTESAIGREKQIKAGSRAKKMALIQQTNPELRDLALDMAEEPC